MGFVPLMYVYAHTGVMRLGCCVAPSGFNVMDRPSCTYGEVAFRLFLDRSGGCNCRMNVSAPNELVL